MMPMISYGNDAKDDEVTRFIHNFFSMLFFKTMNLSFNLTSKAMPTSLQDDILPPTA